MAMMHINSEQFNLRVKGDAPALVEFMAPWCVYCRRIAPALQKVAEQYSDHLHWHSRSRSKSYQPLYSIAADRHLVR